MSECRGIRPSSVPFSVAAIALNFFLKENVFKKLIKVQRPKIFISDFTHERGKRCKASESFLWSMFRV